MIQLNELRVGSLVYFNGNLQEIGSVTEIKKNLITGDECVVLDYRSDILHQTQHLQPIPLTEELLLKFGFEKDEIIEFYRKYKTSSTIIIDFNFVCLLGYSHVKIQTVNQLQNLYFSLTEKELIIT